MRLTFIHGAVILLASFGPISSFAQIPREYLQCPQINLSETLMVELQGVFDPDLQIRDANNKIVATLKIDRDLMFRISGLELSDENGQTIASYKHRFFGRPIFNICTQEQIARIEIKGISGFSVKGTDGQAMYRVAFDTDTMPSRFRVYAHDLLVAEGAKSGNHSYRVRIIHLDMRRDDVLPLLFGLSVYSMSDWDLSEDLRPLDDIVW